MLRAIFILLWSCYSLPLYSNTVESEDHEYPWGSERHEELVNLVEQNREQIENYQTYQYPIKNIDSIFNDLNSQKVLIFSYGSLLNQTSAERTLSHEAMETYRPAMAFGVKRVFNRSVPETTRWGPREGDKDIGMLNLTKVEDIGTITNGVIFEVDKHDLSELAKREEGYDLVPVMVMLWEDAIDSESKKPAALIAYTFYATDEARNGKVYVDPCINPVPGYYLASKKGAAQYGKDFLSVWMDSTFLADSETPVDEWEEYPVLTLCGD